jgi:hypothetical protein
MYNDGEEIPESLEGNMSMPNTVTSQPDGKLEFNTLDEPIKTTVVSHTQS